MIYPWTNWRKQILWEKFCGTSIAQMIEHSTGNRKDLGSIPSEVEALLFSQKKKFKYILKIKWKLESYLVFIMFLVHCTWYFATSSGHFNSTVTYCNRACAVQMYKALSVRLQRCTKEKKNKKKITLRCMVIGTCAVQCLHYIPLYLNTQHYTTLNCSVKSSLRAGGTQNI